MSRNDLGLGRRWAPDPRDEAYPLKAVLPKKLPAEEKYWWDLSAFLDQGNTGTCVGHALAHWVEDGPVTHEGAVDPFALYREACLIDEWSDNDSGDVNFGTSVRAGAKALVNRGLVTEYRWGFTVDDIAAAILAVGPVVLGVNWYSTFDEPEGEDGIVKLDATSYVRGGHAFVVNGYNPTTGLFRGKNSWSREWGDDGRFRFDGSVMERLLNEDGEAMLAIEGDGA